MVNKRYRLSQIFYHSRNPHLCVGVFAWACVCVCGCVRMLLYNVKCNGILHYYYIFKQYYLEKFVLCQTGLWMGCPNIFWVRYRNWLSSTVSCSFMQKQVNRLCRRNDFLCLDRFDGVTRASEIGVWALLKQIRVDLVNKAKCTVCFYVNLRDIDILWTRNNMIH